MTDSTTAREHTCGRCREIFKCKYGPFCKAGTVVMPNIVQADGTITEHCPLQPDWDWIRAYGDRMRAQGHIEATRITATALAEMRKERDSDRKHVDAAFAETDRLRQSLEHRTLTMGAAIKRAEAAESALAEMRKERDEANTAPIIDTTNGTRLCLNCGNEFAREQGQDTALRSAMTGLSAELNTLAVSAFEKMSAHYGDQRKADLYEAIGQTITECVSKLNAALLSCAGGSSYLADITKPQTSDEPTGADCKVDPIFVFPDAGGRTTEPKP